KEKVGQINTTVDKAGAISKALTMEIKRIQNGNSRGRMDESEATGGEMGRPEGRKTIQSIKSNVDPALIVHLNEVKRRGEVLNVTVTLTMIGNKEESESFIIYDFESHVMDYDAAKMYGHVKLDGFTSGRLKQGDVKTFHATFRSPPKDTKMVGITFSGLGTFDDVELK
ncbi:MAG TPA: hypothetical protein VI387_06825, partial [Candidatus Brocadiales bacterium]|nr:hypothetical protein [Candidatus Brocadiales bacterium]